MGKKGRRTIRDEKLVAEGTALAEAKIAEQAAAEGVAPQVIRDRLVELARVREMMIAQYEGTGTDVTGVEWDHEAQAVKVTIKPPSTDGAPDALVDIRQRAAVARAEQAKLNQARQRTAEFELERVFGPSRSSLSLLFSIGLE